ncbi:unnamed protein product [Peniophora sp. CBMAI 1063]|nr:unnamed protein product [Peniophora sp. CBMAI 1063]
MPSPRRPDPIHVLSFATNSLRNTTISNSDDTLYYEVVTRFWHPHLTKIFKLDKEARQMRLVGEIDREPSREPRVRVGGERSHWIPLDDYMKWGSKGSGTWATPEGDSFRWKKNRRRLQLFKTDVADAATIARYVPYTRHFYVLLVDRRASLEVKDEALGHMDQIIMSYLLVERKRRDERMRVKVGRS